MCHFDVGYQELWGGQLGGGLGKVAVSLQNAAAIALLEEHIWSSKEKEKK